MGKNPTKQAHEIALNLQEVNEIYKTEPPLVEDSLVFLLESMSALLAQMLFLKYFLINADKSYTVFLLKKIKMKPCEMFGKVMNKFPTDQTCLKHEIFEDQIFSLHGPSIQILHSNSGKILFKVSCGIWLVNVSLSTELLSVCVSWGNGAYAITL